MSDKDREKSIYKITIIGSITNLLLVIFKFIAGILGQSAAMVADAVHSLSDFITDIVVIAFIRISGKPRDESHQYGHGKFETLATLIIGFILLIIGTGIAYNGITDIISVIRGNSLPTPRLLALIVALLSIISKEILYQYTYHQGKKTKSSVVIANAWHHRSDAFSSIGTAIGIGGAIILGDKWAVLDPIAAFIVSLFIIKIAFTLMKPAISELMEESLPEEVEKEITSVVGTFPEVHQLHNLHTRKIGNKYAIEFHIRMDGQTTLEKAHETISDIEKKLREHYGIQTHIMIHMEPLK